MKSEIYSKYLVSEISIPKYSNQPKNKKFLNFLKNDTVEEEHWLSCNKELEALQVTENAISINSKKCIGCLNCLIGNSKFSIINNDAKKRLGLDLFENDLSIIKKIEKQEDIFSGTRIELPFYSTLDRKYASFEKFTATSEVGHIALWGLSALKFLSSNKNSRVGREIEIYQTKNPRDGRLDICIINNSQVLIVETKTDFSSMVTENRYREQIPKYQYECKKMIDEFSKQTSKNIDLQVLLLVGGNETDLYPPTHQDCTSNVGQRSEKFYADLSKFNIKFISANSLWILILNAIFAKKKICWDLLFPKIFSNDDVVGLVTSGLIRKKDGTIIVESISNQLKSSSSVEMV